MKDQRHKILDHHQASHNISEDTSHFLEVGLAFKIKMYDEASDGSFTSYVSICESIFIVNNDTYTQPHVTNRPTPQSEVLVGTM